MKWITWDAKLSSGHVGIDHGHKQLVDLINQLADGMENEMQKDSCSNALVQFVRHTEEHFVAEEEMMNQNRYPKAIEHKALHVAMLKDVLAFKASYDATDAVESITLLVVLDSWLKRDIFEADKELANFVAAGA